MPGRLVSSVPVLSANRWPEGHEPRKGKNQEAVWAAAYAYYAETLAPSQTQVSIRDGMSGFSQSASL